MAELDRFIADLDNIAEDDENTVKAYNMAYNNSNRQTAYATYQRKFLNNYNKLSQSPFEPMDQKVGKQLQLTGVRYTHDGITEDIDFNNPENAEYKNAFEQAYMKMMLSARVYQKVSELCIYKSGEHENQYVIASANRTSNGLVDPLDKNEWKFTRFLCDHVRERWPGCTVAIETGKTLLMDNDEKTGLSNIYISDASILDSPKEQMARAHRIMSVSKNQSGLPFDILRKNINHDRLAYTPEINHPPEYTQEIAVTPKGSEKGPSPQKTIITQQKQSTKTLNREQTFEFLTYYGQIADTKEKGNILLKNNDYEPDANRDEMLKDMQGIMKTINSKTPWEICERGITNKIKPDNLDGLASTFMRGTKGSLRYYPVYNMTGTRDKNKYKEPLALASIDSKDWTLHGLIRMDDPEANIIYEQVKQELDMRVNGRPAPAQESRGIPESQKPDFMKDIAAPEDSTQYE